MTSEVHTVGFYFTCGQAALLILYCAVLRFVSSGRPCAQKDGLLALSTWPTFLRVWLPFALVVLLAIPTIIFVFSNAVGGILAWLEDWTFMEGFEYVIGNLQNLAISPMSPNTLAGKLLDAFISVFAMVFASLVMGFCTQMSVISYTEPLFSTSLRNFLGTYSAIMVFILVTCFVFGMAFVLVQDVSFLSGFFYMISQVSGIQNPLTPVGPRTHTAYFVSGLSTVVALSVGGAIVGLLGGHPLVLRMVDLVEASSEEERHDGFIPADTKAKILTEERVNELERKVEELQGNLVKKDVQIEELQCSITVLSAAVSQRGLHLV